MFENNFTRLQQQKVAYSTIDIEEGYFVGNLEIAVVG